MAGQETAHHDAAYVEASAEAQAKHRDRPWKSGDSTLAWSLFIPLTPCPHDGRHGTWVVHSWDGIPFPWLEVGMPQAPGSVTIIPSSTIHNGGGKPLSEKGPKYVAFFAITEEPQDYNLNQGSS